MNKEELLNELSTRIKAGDISREELMSHLNFPTVVQSENTEGKETLFSVTKVLYVLGAVIVIIGISIFVHQIWGSLGSFWRILVTLGLGLLITASGSIIINSKADKNLGATFHFIGGLLIPGGAVVTLVELSTGAYHPWIVVITFGVIFAFYLLLNAVHKSTVLTFFAIANGTALVYLTVSALIGETSDSSFRILDIYKYLTMAMGVSYILLCYAFRDKWSKKLIWILNFIGIIAFLGTAFSQVFDSITWQILYFLFVIGGLFLSVYLKNGGVLIISTLFLLAHVSYITSEYFGHSMGWPVSLVILGFLFILFGYISISINKKYIAN
ncbi:MAG: hypothetical protein NTV72_02600 [Candidatus Taylorbacteria bacterium]|nr:hypothetical protein [Candidatus Taylorbacteria bacterium]